MPRSPGSLMLVHGWARPCRRRWCSQRKGPALGSIWHHRPGCFLMGDKGVLETFDKMEVKIERY